MEYKLFAIGKIASNCITTAKIADGCLSGSGVFRTVVDKTKNKNQNMQVTDKDTLIITIDGKTKLLTREEITNAFRDKTQYQKNMEAVQKDWDERLRQNNCANYERDNNLSEMEQNVATYIIGIDPYQKDTQDFSFETSVLRRKNIPFPELLKELVKYFPKNKLVEEVDPIVQKVRQKLLDRSAVGIKKYNSSIFDNIDENYIKHLQEELLDGANYCEQVLRLGEFTKTIIEILQSDQNEMSVGNKIIREYNKLKETK